MASTTSAPEALLSLPFQFDGVSWPLKDFVKHMRDNTSIPSDLNPYLSKAAKRALKSGSKRTDLGPGDPRFPSWADLVAKAAALPQPPPLQEIESFTPAQLNGALELTESMSHQKGREVLGRILESMEALHWKKWGNPFKLELTPENCAALGAPTYFQIIKKAMSLTAMRRAFETQETYSLPMFHSDMDLMITNAQTFNQPGDPVYEMAGEMRAQLERAIATERNGGDARTMPPPEKKRKGR